MSLDRAALPFVLAFGASAALLFLWSPWAALPSVALTLFSLWFFRDPRRTPPEGEGLLVSPADGKIIRVDPRRISIFLNVFDVHVCRTPAAGKVETVEHIRGRFLAAFRHEASEANERAVLTVRPDRGAPVRFVLVAGLVARRIVCRVEPGDVLRAGDRVGLIRFGSRVDVDLPEAYAARVTMGQRVVAGETILAERTSR
jgi:phosphatidylserine decarboxylase